MAKFKKGDNIKNSSLYVLEYVSSSRIRCGCSSCGKGLTDDLVSMVYNESDLVKGGISCRFCNEVEKAKSEGYYNERNIYMELLEKSLSLDVVTAKVNNRYVITDEKELGIPNFTKQFPLGTKYGELTSIAYMTTVKKKDEYGIHFTIPTHLVLKCESCKYITFIEVKNIGKVVNVCPLCFKLRNKMKEKLKQREDNKIKRDTERNQDKDFQYIKSEFSKLATNKAMQKSVKALEDKNKGYKVVDISKDGGATTYHLVCNDCGSIVTCMRSNAKIGECKFCKDKKDNKDFTRVGYLYKDYTGSIFNGLKVVSQSGLSCEVECIKCGKKKKNLDTFGVLSKRYYCDCIRSKIRIECPNCFAPLPDVSYNDIYTSNLPICPDCKQSVDESEFLIAIESMDYGNSLRAKLELANRGISDKAVKQIRFGNKFAVDTLIVERDSVYKGNNEKSYYRCFCKKHNVGLTLSEDEIQSYNCEFCDDSRQKIIANPDSSSIKLS